MKTGFAALPITVENGTIMAGYAPYRQSTGIHDTIYIRALLWQGETPVVMIQFDIVMAEAILKQAIAERLQAHGYFAEQILVSATHTHSSIGHIADTRREPLMESICGSLSMECIHTLADLAEQAVLQAETKCKETSIRMGEIQYKGLGSNRIDPQYPSDQQLAVIELTQEDDTKLLIYNLACHATVMDQRNTQISADFPGAVNELLKDRYAMVMFLNGSCGDMSTRFTRKESSFAECERLASGVANAISEALADQPMVPLQSVAIRNFTVSLPAVKIPTLAEAKQNLAQAKKEWEEAIAAKVSEGKIRLAKEKYAGSQFKLMAAEHHDMAVKNADTVEVPCALFTLQGKRILFQPLELYSSLSLQIKAKEAIWIVGYTNHALCYLPDQAGYERHDYESSMSMFARGAGELFVAKILDQLRS